MNAPWLAARRNAKAPPMVGKRPASLVMRLERLGSAFPTRLSFMRVLLRRMAKEGWGVSRDRFALDEQGYGTAVYRVDSPDGQLCLTAFSHALDPDKRTDRVIAEAWDSTFALVNGVPDEADIARLRANVPRQEAGRVSAREMVLSRANRSVRLFDYVVGCLARGAQPDTARLASVGYLMRTTAVYGNGKFGLADMPVPHTHAGLRGAFLAEMLCVHLIRQFTIDLVEHVARARAGSAAVSLGQDGRLALGIGNSTGLGMAPFLVTHPQLLHHWIDMRETALARVRAVEAVDRRTADGFVAWLERAVDHVQAWETEDKPQAARIARLRVDLAELLALVEDRRAITQTPQPWAALYTWAERFTSLEAQELLVSLMLEVNGRLIDDLGDEGVVAETLDIDPAVTVAQLRDAIEWHYGWALKHDYAEPGEQHYFWYVSEEKLEPRLGVRADEPGGELESRLGIGRDVAALHDALATVSPRTLVAEFLMDAPAYRGAVRRVQSLARLPYAEIRDNVLAARMRPIDMLRCKLALFGASRFDPKSDKWTRITMYQGAPLAFDLTPENADGWAFYAPPTVAAEAGLVAAE